jgi:hypothetical protein
VEINLSLVTTKSKDLNTLYFYKIHMTKDTSIGSRIEELEKVWTPEARWTIPKAPGEPTFMFPAFGRGSYDNDVKQVLDAKQRLATGEQSAFMLDEAYNSVANAIKNSPRTEFVRQNIMHDRWLWIPSVNVWTPKDAKNPGMYAVFDEEGHGLNREYTIEELEDRLQGSDMKRGVRFSQDRTVAFAPRNTIKSKEHEKGTLSQDGAFIAVYSPEGAEALDKVAENFALKPYSLIINNNSDKPVQTLSALDGSSIGFRLNASFISGGLNGFGYVVSVSGSNSSAEGTAPKN